jgi:hypothetical protein
MDRKKITNRGVIIPIIVLQIVPLLLFPASSFAPTTQEWWLPALLVVMVLFAIIQLLIGRNNSVTPWHLMSFAQGFNLISRLMMIWPHATINVQGASVLNWDYIGLTVLSAALSAFLLWYTELPEVRMNMARN